MRIKVRVKAHILRSRARQIQVAAEQVDGLVGSEAETGSVAVRSDRGGCHRGHHTGPSACTLNKQ